MARDLLMLRLMLSQDTMAMEDMVLDMDMAVMGLVIEDTDTEVTMARDLLMLRLMLSQDTMDMEVMVLVMDMGVMGLVIEDMDTEVTMARDLLMLRQDTTDTEAMDMVDTEVMEVMDMVEDITDKKLVHINQLKAINHKFYFKTDSFSQLSKLLNKRNIFSKKKKKKKKKKS